MQRAPARGAVRAKTGTTNRASALSGYVRDRYVFAVMQNGWPVVDVVGAQGAGPLRDDARVNVC